MAHNAAAAVNHGEGVPLPETSSRCVMEGVVHNFEMKDCALLEGMGACKTIASTTFSAGGYNWKIRFYPDGNNKDCAGYASAYVVYLSEAKDVRAKYTLTMIDDQGNTLQEIYKDKVVDRIFPQKDSSWGFPKYVEKSKLKSSPHLTLRCVLVVIKEPPTECETNPIVVPPPELAGHLERALENGRGADVTLLVGGREFRAHRFMLATRSPVFDAQLFGPMMDRDTQHIEVDDMEPAILGMLLHFVYTDSLPKCNENKYDVATMQHLLVAADRYGLDRLKVMCENILCKSIDIKTVNSTLALANQHYCEGLKNACLEFMSMPGVAAIVFDGFQRHMAHPTTLVLGENLEDKVAPIARKKYKTPEGVWLLCLFPCMILFLSLAFIGCGL